MSKFNMKLNYNLLYKDNNKLLKVNKKLIV